MKAYRSTSVETIEQQIVNHVEYTVAKTRFNFTAFNAYQATAYSVRDRLIENLNDTNEYILVSPISITCRTLGHVKCTICQANLWLAVNCRET